MARVVSGMDNVLHAKGYTLGGVVEPNPGLGPGPDVSLGGSLPA